MLHRGASYLIMLYLSTRKHALLSTFFETALTHSSGAGLVHLTRVNPQVPGTSSSLPKQLLSQWHLPRVGGAAPQAIPTQLSTCGTSAFAFQGTNAHIIQQQPPTLQSQLHLVAAAAATAWQRQRHWVAPPLAAFLGGCTGTAASGLAGVSRHAGVVMMQVDLTGARAAFLRQFRVRDNAMMPAAGFAHLCSAAASVMAHDGDTSGDACKLLSNTAAHARYVSVIQSRVRSSVSCQ